MSLPGFSLQILSFTLIGLLASAAGALLLPPPSSTGAVTVQALFLLLAFVGLLALKRTSSWNVGLLVLFGVLAGSFSNLIQPDGGSGKWWSSLGTAVLVLVLSQWISRRWRKNWGEIGLGLWILIWIYLIGWAGLFLLPLAPVFHRVWAGFGLVLFGGITAVWFSNIEQAFERHPGAALGIDLYLLTLNIILAARILVFGPG